MSSKVVSLREAVAAHVHDGDTLAIEGFTHLISFAAGHEVIRQGRRDLTLARLTPDLVYDQMVAAGCASKLVFSWLGNPGVGSLHAIRRAIEAGELELRSTATTAWWPATPPAPAACPSSRCARTTAATCRGQSADPARGVTVRRRGDRRRPAAQPGRHDHPRPARRCRRQCPGLGDRRGAARGGPRRPSRDRRRRGAGRRIGHSRRSRPHAAPGTWSTPSASSRSGPTRPSRRATTTATTPSIATGTRSAATPRAWTRWLDEWVRGLDGRAAYVDRLGPQALDALRPEPRPSGSVDYGSYR